MVASGCSNSTGVRADVVAHVPLASRTYAAAISSAGVVYVGQPDLARLVRADLPQTSFTGTVAVGNTPTEVAFNSSGTKAYVTNQFSQNVGVIDVATNTQTTTVPVSGNPFAVIVAPGDSMVYVTTTADSLFAIRASTNTIAHRLSLPIISNGFAIHDSLLYVSTRDVGTVTVIGLKSNAILRTLTVGGLPQGIVVSPDGTQLYVANQTGDLQFWSIAGDSSVGVALLAGRGFGLAQRPSDGKLYVTTLEAGQVQIVDPTTHLILQSINVGGVPRRIAFDASGSIGVVANEGSWVDFLR
jgi:YVTN family beta-propeller protein